VSVSLKMKIFLMVASNGFVAIDPLSQNRPVFVVTPVQGKIDFN